MKQFVMHFGNSMSNAKFKNILLRFLHAAMLSLYYVNYYNYVILCNVSFVMKIKYELAAKNKVIMLRKTV